MSQIKEDVRRVLSEEFIYLGNGKWRRKTLAEMKGEPAAPPVKRKGILVRIFGWLR